MSDSIIFTRAHYFFVFLYLSTMSAKHTSSFNFKTVLNRTDGYIMSVWASTQRAKSGGRASGAASPPLNILSPEQEWMPGALSRLTSRPQAHPSGERKIGTLWGLTLLFFFLFLFPLRGHDRALWPLDPNESLTREASSGDSFCLSI